MNQANDMGRRKASEKRSVTHCIFLAGLGAIALVYCLALVKIVVLKNGFTTFSRGINWVPFQFVTDFAEQSSSLDVLLKNVLGNFALFVPLGILLPAFFRRMRPWQTVLAGFCVSLSFEILQYCTGWGFSDVDDLILNTLGCGLGAVLYFGLFARGGKRVRGSVLSFSFLTVFGLCGVLALWLYQPGMLPQQVNVAGEAVVAGLSLDDYTVTAFSDALDGDVLRCDAVRSEAGAAAPAEFAPRDSYTLSADAELITKTFGYDYSPNGNIRGMDITYEAVGADAVAQLLNADQGDWVDLWLDDGGEIATLMVTVRAN